MEGSSLVEIKAVSSHPVGGCFILLVLKEIQSNHHNQLTQLLAVYFE